MALAPPGGLTLFLILALVMTGTLVHKPLAGSFYAMLPHNLLVLMLGIVFGYVALVLGIGVANFWREVSPGTSSTQAFAETTSDAMQLRYLDGGRLALCQDQPPIITKKE